MVLLLIISFAFICYLLFTRDKKKLPKPTDDELTRRNREWVNYIAAYKNLATTKDQKQLVSKMLSDLEAQGLADTSETHVNPINQQQVVQEGESSESETALKNVLQPETHRPVAVQKAQIQLDNASLLLYLGAFLFVASAGLFVVFGGIQGELRCMVVFLVSMTLYGGGVWLFRNSKKLQQAGLAFAGIGIAIAPLIGLAAYNYIFDKSNGSAVWFGTSLFCLILYTHALFTLRKPLINYVFILTFLSLFEASISMIHVPIYYFGWMLAAVGLILMAVSKFSGVWPDLQESSKLSSAVLLPLSVFASFVMVPNQGAGQLGVSLLLAAAYYGLEILNSVGDTKQLNAIIAQSSTVVGISCLVYAYYAKWPPVAICLSVLALVQVLVLLLRSKSTVLWENFATFIVATAIAACIAGIQKSELLLATSIVLILVGLIIWLRQHRVDAYVVSALSLMTIPFIFGKYQRVPPLNPSVLALLFFMCLGAQLVIMVLRRKKFSPKEVSTLQLTYIVSAIAVLVSTFWASPAYVVLISTLVVATMIPLTSIQKDSDWAIIAGIFIAVPFAWLLHSPHYFLIEVIIALFCNVFLSLVYRKEANRWLSTIIWLIVPIAIGGSHIFGHWHSGIYAWAYLVAMLVLVISRAIARGVLFPSNKIALASYARNASLSYVVGYCAAGIVAIGLALSFGNYILLTLVLTFISITVWVLSEYVEKQPEILLLLPLFLQAILLSLLHPHIGETKALIYTISSSVLALASYFAMSEAHNHPKELESVQYGALVAIFFTPASAFFFQHIIWTMPVGLLVASLLVFYHVRNMAQEYREIAGGLIALALCWILYFMGVRNVQVFSHMFVALFALYAYWRHTRKENSESDSYILVALATATVPLAAQALSGAAGGLYGWWLILEQIFIILIGMTIAKRFVTMWGLYVAVGAVLYQLRDLGWAALTVLAVFLIGLAVYKIQKYTEKHDS